MNQQQIESIYSMNEAVADICFNAGHDDFHPTGDSRADIALFIVWAEEFENVHKGVKWGEDEKMPDGTPFPYSDDYIEAIDAFYVAKKFEYACH